jgi:hypothetical protein
MLRRFAQLAVPTYRRAVHTSAACWQEAAHTPEQEEFLKKFSQHVTSTTAPPNFPGDFVPATAPADASGAVPDKLTLNFYLPHEQTLKSSKVRHTSFRAFGARS